MKKLFTLGTLCLLLTFFTSCNNDGKGKYIDYVNVFIGTGGHGHTFPGATMPHGMVQLSPDTRLLGWDACGGYYFDDSSIHGFSHTHLSGTGIGDYGDILFMPVVGKTPLVAGTDENPDEGYRSRFSHEQEQAYPGYYQVKLLDYDINAELTSTMRAGMHRYTYPQSGDANLIIDMDPTIHGHRHPVTEITVVNDTTISGMKYTKGWAANHYVYFYAVFSKPFTAQLYSAENPVEGNSIVADTTKVVLTFKDLGADRQVLAKVGISSVDVDGARKNLEAEIPAWDFDQVVADAGKAWEDELGRIDVQTKDDNERTIFYTALYHSAISPCVASDVDGRYRTMDHQIVENKDYTNYTIFSTWDTFRALHPLNTIINPSINQEFIRALLNKYDEGGILPKWELASNYTGTMIGYHAVSVIADAYMKGQRDYDINKALEACIRSSVYDTTGLTKMLVNKGRVMPTSIKSKNELGYIPFDKPRTGGSVAQGMEFAYNDWLIGQMAKDQGKNDIYEKYQALSQNYKNYYDDSTGLMRGRKADGSWRQPFDPMDPHVGDYTEGNAWQWAWFAPQDVDGLVALMGGKDKFTAQLDRMFTLPLVLEDPSTALDITGLIGQYAHGNEPSHHIPFLYNYVDEAWKTQEMVDSIMYTYYFNDPNGLSGNEDCGQMSAWYVLNALGFYSFCPGNPVYAIGRPMFDEATIKLENGNKFVVKVKDNSKKNKYIQSVKLNGEPLSFPEITHAAIEAGGELEFVMGPEPKKDLFAPRYAENK